MLMHFFSSLEGDIIKVVKILNSRNWINLVFIFYQRVGQFDQAYTGQVIIESY